MGPSRREFLKSAGVAGAVAVAGGSCPVPAGASARVQSGGACCGRSRPTCWRSATRRAATRPGFRSSCCTGFPMTSGRGTGSFRRWPTPGTGCWCRTCAATARRASATPDASRMAEQAAIAQDVSDFADALGLEQVALAGFDWGNRAACITSILHPERVRAQVAIGGYSVQDTVSPSAPSPSAAAEARLWYQWYFNTERGRAGLEANRHAIVRYLWETWSPTWEYNRRGLQSLGPGVRQPGLRRRRHSFLPAPARLRAGRGALSRRRARAGRPAAD